jgi:UPF0271 protein
MLSIDLNCDLGEGAGHDGELMPLITSANIACGAHAGDAATMRRTLELALEHGVAIGAHPGFNDREHFGRRELPVTAVQVRELVLTQTRLLQQIARESGACVTHLKPHGALYNQAAREPALAEAIVDTVLELDPGIRVFGLAGSQLIAAARQRGLVAANEVFADRTYQADGTLTPRALPDAMVQTEQEAVEQVLRMLREGRVLATDGTSVAVSADTICLHGDGPEAVAFAKRLRRELFAAGIAVRRFSPGQPLSCASPSIYGRS